MNIWILTIGNSDVQLNNNNNHWNELYSGNLLKQVEIENEFGFPISFEPKENPVKREYLLLPARFLGLVYDTEHISNYYQDLCFPLLDNFHKTITNTEFDINIDRFFYLLTNQEDVFSSQADRKPENLGYWQDTIRLKDIIEKYLNDKFGSDFNSEELVLEPKKSSNSDTLYKGLDDWDYVLDLVNEQFKTIIKDEDINLEQIETVYISHQAGTPAISSAVQFSSLAFFGNKVKFLVSNELSGNPAYLIEGSNYLKGIQLQQAKQLVQSGIPGAAQELLDVSNVRINDQLKKELEELVNIFNIKNPGSTENDFTVDITIKRVIQALDLVEIYFEQKNYIQGITLLAAAHEAFMKAAIVNELKKLFPITFQRKFNSQTIPFTFEKLSELLIWNNEGLVFFSYANFNSSEREKFKEYFKYYFEHRDGNFKKLTPLLKNNIKILDKDEVTDETKISNFSHKLKFSTLNNIQNKRKILNQKVKIEILEQLKYPLDSDDYQLKLWEQWCETWWFGTPAEREKKYVRLKKIDSNQAMYQWLLKLKQPDDEYWGLLKFIGKFDREREDDKRNQIMHNLRGVEEKDVIKYLKGLDISESQDNQNLEQIPVTDDSESQDDQNPEQNSVTEVYIKEVKEPFIQAIKNLGLYKEENPNLQAQLNELAQKLSQ